MCGDAVVPKARFSNVIGALTNSVSSHTVGCTLHCVSLFLGKLLFRFRLEPQLKQLQIKYDELEERKSSLRNAACFLSNLKQLHQDYSDVRQRGPPVKETVSPVATPHGGSGGAGPWQLAPVALRGSETRRNGPPHTVGFL